ncbi:MAG TPA: LysM peptidoglycan-binding domain-containing protein, partial [Dehalococcoidia bacterium]|nr:LysM peptidoglycan-binding domain-containing protein [Dehalococcoidia bacterium]
MMQMSIPLRSAVVLAVTLAAVVISPVLASAYTVVEGDTLSSIAGKTGASVSEIIEANDIADPDLIVPGQEIVVPGSGGGEYTVRPGDTLSAIASRFGV